MAKAKTNPTKSAPSGQPGVSQAPRQLLHPDSLPDLYIMIADGTCMEPKLPNGAHVICEKTAVKAGDFVVLYYRPECIPAGEHQAQLKRLVLNIPHFVKFPWRNHPGSDVSPLVAVEMLNPRRQFYVGCHQLLAVHKCVGVVPKDATYDADRRTWAIPASALSERKSLIGNQRAS